MTAPDRPRDAAQPALADRDRWHTVVLDVEYGTQRFECTAPFGAECRCFPVCQHDDGTCADAEGYHSENCSGDMTPVDAGECNTLNWINNYEECGRGEVRIPVATDWQGDCWTWRPALANARRAGTLVSLDWLREVLGDNATVEAVEEERARHGTACRLVQTGAEPDTHCGCTCGAEFPCRASDMTRHKGKAALAAVLAVVEQRAGGGGDE